MLIYLNIIGGFFKTTQQINNFLLLLSCLREAKKMGMKKWFAKVSFKKGILFRFKSSNTRDIDRDNSGLSSHLARCNWPIRAQQREVKFGSGRRRSFLALQRSR